MSRILLILVSSLLACSNPSDMPSTTSETVDQKAVLDTIAQKWKRSQNQFTQEMKTLSDMERLYVVRKVLSNPKAEHSPRLCQTLNRQHHNYCIQMLGRSHIWDIPVSTDPVLPKKTVTVAECAENDIWCLTSNAIQETKHERIERAEQICTGLPDTQAQEECFFQSAEQISKQDRSGSLEDAFRFCNQTTAYQEHCHAHIIEHSARTFQPPPDILVIIESNASERQSSFLQNYYLTMKARQSPFDRFVPYWDKHSVQTLIFLSTQTKADHTLSHWIELFTQSQSNLSLHELKLDEEINNYWIQQGRAQHPSKLYLSMETRPFSEDESLDLQFAMVAGLIQREFPVDKIKTQSEQPTIQWMINRAGHKR